MGNLLAHSSLMNMDTHPSLPVFPNRRSNLIDTQWANFEEKYILIFFFF